jgi:BirA family biotin operon repressor/biotin-[acetyl-CoA-carboxylase] ligase
MTVDPVAAAVSGARLISLNEVGSTSAEALERARAGERGELWITAARQTAGRGRRGRPWVSEPGNLYASLLLTDQSASHAAELSLVAALALHDALIDVAAMLGPRLKFKWPNDLICDGAKLAGILVEAEGVAGRPVAVVIGIGVNCMSHPRYTSYPATDLKEAGALVAPQTLLRSLIATMRLRLDQWACGEGFGNIRAAWLARAAGIGEVMSVQAGERQLEGTFETLDDRGRLVLRLPDGGCERIPAGDVGPPIGEAHTRP